jgi:hypothetical protein
MPRLILASLAVLCLFGLAACGTSITRLSPTQAVDISGKWNAEDSRQVAEKLIDKSLSDSWADEFLAAKGRKPVVQIGRVVVRSNGDVIDTDIFTDDLRRAFIESKRVGVVGKDAEMAEIRAAQVVQEERATEETRSKAFAETGADFRIQGTIKVQDDRQGNTVNKFYSVDLIFTNIQTGEQILIVNHKISKLVENAKFR